MTKNTYTIMCPNCGKTYEHIKKAMICTQCGNVAKVPPLSDGAFEKLAEGEGLKDLPAIEKKDETDTRDRPAEDGGPVM
jgi:predicted amidophosphoribosyltransferase